VLLAVDVGNSDIVLGLFEGEALVRRWRLSTEADRTADEYAVLVRSLLDAGRVSPAAIEAVAIASVVPPLLPVWRAVATDAFGRPPFIFGEGGDVGIEVRVDMAPTEVGADILCNAIAARALCGAPVIVVDFGTATTVNAVDGDGAYAGSAIAPGLGTSADALFAKAARLPRVALARPARAIGTTTASALQSGLVLGAAGQVDALVGRMRDELGARAPVVATGALADLVASASETIDRVEPWLTLHGLRQVAAGRAGGAA